VSATLIFSACQESEHVIEKRLDYYIIGVWCDGGAIKWAFSRNKQIGLGL
jgi:hypothetical protein